MKRPVLLLVGVLCFVPSTFPQTAEEKKATIAYLRKLQTKDGGFVARLDDKEKPSLRATSAAVRALHYLGGEVPNRDTAAAFVKSCHDVDSGSFADEPGGKPAVFPTAVGAMAVVALKMPVEKYEAGVVKYLDKNAKSFEEIRIAVAGLEALGKKSAEAGAWTALIEKMRNDAGAFGKGDGIARETGGATVALLRLGAKVEESDRVVKLLDGGQRKDGGFGKEKAKQSDLETTYRVLRAYHMLKAKPEDVAGLRRFIASCRNDDGGYGIEPGQPSNVGGCYYAAIVLQWLDKK